MQLLADGNGTLVGDDIRASELGGEYLGWTGFPGWQKQAEYLGISHIRWPSGINAEDRIEAAGYAFDLSTPTLVDNWPLSNGSPRQGLNEMFDYANSNGASFSMIVPSARYVETMLTDPPTARDWIRSDIEAFATRLFAGDFGTVPTDFTLEIGAEYYSTNAWAQNVEDYALVEAFARVFAELVSALHDAELTYETDLYNIAVQAARFQSNDDIGQVRDGQLSDAEAFIAEFQAASVENAIDALIWHRYVYMFDQTSHHLTPGGDEHTLEDHLVLWEDALGHALDLTVGWAAPDIDRDDASLSDPFFDFGPRAAHSMLQMFSELSEAGMDQATIYGIDTQWTGALSTGSNNPNEFIVSFHGEVYGLMSSSLEGLTATDAFHGNSVITDEQNGIVVSDHVNVFGFSDNATRHVQYSAMWDLASESVSLAVASPSNFNASLVALRVVSPTSLDSGATGQFRAVDAALDHSGVLVVQDMSDFEVLQSVFQLDDAVVDFFESFQTVVNLENGRRVVSLGFDSDQYQAGSSQDGTLVLAQDGADEIGGSALSDMLIGGDGADVINGGGGGDILIGGGVSSEAISAWLSADSFVFDQNDFFG